MTVSNQHDLEDIARGIVQACTDLAQHAQALVALQGADQVAKTPDRLRHARQLYAQRRIRETFLEPDLFSEPSWDVLLHLYIEHFEGRRSITSDVQRASRSGPATYRRWLDKLVERGLVEKTPTEGREVFVKLTDRAIETLDALLESSAEGPDMPMIGRGR